MDQAERRKLIRIISRNTGLKITEWIEKHIKTSYASFTYRLANDACTLTDYHMIIQATGMQFEQIWPLPGAASAIAKKDLPVVNMAHKSTKDLTPTTTKNSNSDEVSKTPAVTPGKSREEFVPVIPEVYDDPGALM